MKKLSEVCKLVGVTRRTLQEYDRIGLLKHTDETDSGYWLYGDQDISRLIFISYFIEAGYKRKDVKKILANPSMDLEDEYDKLIELLIEKRKRINGMIHSLRGMKACLHLPEHIKRVIAEANTKDLLERFKNQSFREAHEEEILAMSEYSDEDMDEVAPYRDLFLQVSAIGYLKKESISSEKVKKCFTIAARTMWNVTLIGLEITPGEIEEELEDCPEEEFGETVKDLFSEYFGYPEVLENIDKTCGSGGADFVKEVCTTYRLRKADLKED